MTEVKPFNGILAEKIGMTEIFDEKGNYVPVTVLKAGPCPIVYVRTKEKDGYQALALGFGKKKKATKPVLGQLKKIKKDVAFSRISEFRTDIIDGFEPGQEIKVDIFKPGEKIAASGISIGKGFQGTVKRHHFNRGPMAHGSKSHRLPGSIGAGTTPGRVLKGLRMAGHMGSRRVTVKNLKVVQIDMDHNLLLVRGAVPGADGTLLEIRKV
jgi:large subunit ribosomal protein L3